jgi:hypothetical protein
MHLRFLKDLTAHPGPFATVLLDASHDTEDAAAQDDLRWASARAELAGAGADDATLTALDAALAADAPGRGRTGRALVAAGGEVLLDRLLPAPPDRPGTTWAPLPDLLPVLLALPEPVTAVVVRLDKFGGEIAVSGADGDPEPVDSVDGTHHQMHKVRGGGMANRRMQEKVEENWRRNVAALAERVDHHVTTTGAGLLVVAGEVQSRTLLREALSERAAGIAVDVESSGTSPGGGGEDDAALAAAVADAERDAGTATRHAAIEQLQLALGRGEGLAVQGLADVLAALRAEQVETLLVDGSTSREQPVFFSDAPAQVALDRADLEALGVEPQGPAAADAALVRAAAAQDAALVPLGGGRTGLVGHDVQDGVAAVLRYPFVGR